MGHRSLHTYQRHSPLRQAWIQEVTHTIPKQIDGQYGKQNGNAREGGEPPGDVDVVASNGAGCLDKFTFAQRQHFSPDDSGVALPTSQAEHQDDVANAWPQHRDHRKSQNELWESEHNV